MGGGGGGGEGVCGAKLPPGGGCFRPATAVAGRGGRSGGGCPCAAVPLRLTRGFLHAEDVGVLLGVPVPQVRSVLAEVDLEAADWEMRIAASPGRLEGWCPADAAHR